MSLQAAFNVAKEVAKQKLLPAPDKLLSRDGFIAAVNQRFLGYCAFCADRMEIAHQIMDRRLFPDDGYYLGNGIGLCDKHYKYAQATLITVEELRAKAELKAPVLPPNFRLDTKYDRWGNIIINPDMLILGPLRSEPAMHRALTAAKKQATLYEAMAVVIDEIHEMAPPKVPAIALEMEIYARRQAAERRKAERVSQSMPLDITV